MTYQSYNPIEIRYASGELAKGNFVQEKDYLISREYGKRLLNKLIPTVLENCELKEEIEILRAERSHWYHMYNQERGGDGAMPD